MGTGRKVETMRYGKWFDANQLKNAKAFAKDKGAYVFSIMDRANGAKSKKPDAYYVAPEVNPSSLENMKKVEYLLIWPKP